MQRQSNSGFTLIELMLVVMVIAILAAFAYPSYIDYVQRSRRADATSALLSATMAEEKYRTNNTTYGTLAQANISTTSPEGYYTLQINGTPDATTYSISATAVSSEAQFQDTHCRTLTIDQGGTKTATDSSNQTVTDCW